MNLSVLVVKRGAMKELNLLIFFGYMNSQFSHSFPYKIIVLLEFPL